MLEHDMRHGRLFRRIRPQNWYLAFGGTRRQAAGAIVLEMDSMVDRDFRFLPTEASEASEAQNLPENRAICFISSLKRRLRANRHPRPKLVPGTLPS